MYWGCGQPEDVLTPVTQTKVWLHEERLPTTPPDMVYELWLGNITQTDTVIVKDPVSLGRFRYDFSQRIFQTSTGSIRPDSNLFQIDYDILAFNSIFLTVEPTTETALDTPGPIMLLSSATDPTIKMEFPMLDTLWASTIWYNMQSPSNGSDLSDAGNAIWFCTYRYRTESFDDTTGITSWEVDTTADTTTIDGETKVIIVGIDDASIKVDTLMVVKGLDTVQHIATTFDVVEDTLTNAPYYNTKLSINYQIDSLSHPLITWDDFNQGQNNDDFGMPNLKDWGWKYKGWVVEPQIPTSAVGQMTKPAWPVPGSYLDQTDGGLLTTGSFYDVSKPDSANPYTASLRVPPYPGEDFLQNLPAGITAPLNLLPGDGDPGRVFISLEPVNALTDTTNFPLVLFLGPLPSNPGDVQTTDLQKYTLRGWMQTNDPYRGFPLITVETQRF